MGEAAAIEVKKRTENTGRNERVSKKKLGLDIAPYLIMVLPFDVKVSTICFNKRLSYRAKEKVKPQDKSKSGKLILAEICSFVKEAESFPSLFYSKRTL